MMFNKKSNAKSSGTYMLFLGFVYDVWFPTTVTIMCWDDFSRSFHSLEIVSFPSWFDVASQPHNPRLWHLAMIGATWRMSWKRHFPWFWLVAELLIEQQSYRDSCCVFWTRFHRRVAFSQDFQDSLFIITEYTRPSMERSQENGQQNYPTGVAGAIPERVWGGSSFAANSLSGSRLELVPCSNDI